MSQSTTYVFTIGNVRTPSSVVAANNASLTINNIAGEAIAITLAMSTDMITAGELLSATFDSATDTPGFSDVTTVTFKTAGQVEVGGSVTMVMPDLTNSSQFGWNFDDATWVNCTKPILNAVSPAAVHFDAALRALKFTVHGSIMAQNTTYVFQIKNVITPSSVEPSNYIRATTRDSRGKIIDTTSDMVTGHGALVSTRVRP